MFHVDRNYRPYIRWKFEVWWTELTADIHLWGTHYSHTVYQLRHFCKRLYQTVYLHVNGPDNTIKSRYKLLCSFQLGDFYFLLIQKVLPI